MKYKVRIRLTGEHLSELDLEEGDKWIASNYGVTVEFKSGTKYLLPWHSIKWVRETKQPTTVAIETDDGVFHHSEGSPE